MIRAYNDKHLCHLGSNVARKASLKTNNSIVQFLPQPNVLLEVQVTSIPESKIQFYSIPNCYALQIY